MDHALDPLSEDDVVKGKSGPLAILWPFVTVSDRCLLSVTMSSDFREENRLAWRRCFGRVNSIDVWSDAEKILVAVQRCYSVRYLPEVQNRKVVDGEPRFYRGFRGLLFARNRIDVP